MIKDLQGLQSIGRSFQGRTKMNLLHIHVAGMVNLSEYKTVAVANGSVVRAWMTFDKSLEQQQSDQLFCNEQSVLSLKKFHNPTI